MNFVQCNLGAGVRLHMCETDKFKSLTCKMFIQQDLQTQTATSTALIPFLVRRGSQEFPSTLQIARELEYLYAADFSSDILKIGERQILEFYFQMVDASLLPQGEQQLERGLRTFWDIATNPAGNTQAFVEDYFIQEKHSLKQELEGLMNEKRAYALNRATALMCAQEPFGIYKYGDLETLDRLENGQVFEHFQSLWAHYPLDIFLVGTNLDVVANLFGQLVEKRAEIQKLKLPKRIQVVEPRFIEETTEMQQAILILGYRTNCSYLDEDYYPLLVGNGILGGFPHSKLFMNVREKASLAYYVGSSIEGSKGLLTINAGINGENQERTLQIIQEQLRAIQQGDISGDELEQTKRGLISAMTSMNDYPGGIIDRNLMGIIHGEMRSIDQVIEAIRQVHKEDVVRVMEKVVLDTTYVLRAPRQEGDSHGTN